MDCSVACEGKLDDCNFCGGTEACCTMPRLGLTVKNAKACDAAMNGYLTAGYRCTPLILGKGAIPPETSALTAPDDEDEKDEDEKDEDEDLPELVPLSPFNGTHPDEDCSTACQTPGFCTSFCGYGNACCRLGAPGNPPECKTAALSDFDHAKFLSSPTFHQCVTPRWDGGKYWVISSDEACKGKEREVKQCILPACGKCVPVNCAFTDWADWINPEDGTGLLYRSRNVASFNNECGTPCNGVLKETLASPEKPEVGLIPCLFGNWVEWSACDEGGQQYRTRMMPEIPPQKFEAHGCTGGMNETKPCNKLDSVDCKLTDWTEWVTCSKTCGVGRTTRARNILQHAAHGGKPCSDVTIEVKACNEEVPCSAPRNCKLSDWSDWTALEATVILTPKQAATCSTPAHPGDSRNYTSTSKIRKRGFEVTAYWTGSIGCEGDLSEVNGTIEAPPHPCPPQDWSDWSECQSSCGAGQQFRRVGTCLSQALPDQETRPCIDPKPCPDHGGDCELSDWGDWAVCDAKCGQGQSTRSRTILKGRTEGGEGCNATLKEMQGCLVANCTKQDCRWTEWNEWDACSCSCGGGQKARSRSVAAAPRHGGAPCANNSVSEVLPCNTQTCDSECVDGVWATWGNWGVASATCGPSYHCRERSLQIEPNWCGKPAEGDEEECEAVEGPEPCIEDKPCVLEEWAAWGECSCSCYGVTQRTRGIAQMSTGAGKGCEGNLTEMMQCNPVASLWKTPPPGCDDMVEKKPDCIVGEWNEWSQCTATCEGGFKMRNRMIMNEPCQAAESVEKIVLDEIMGCANILCQATTLDCEVTGWSEWTACNSCGANRYRTRAWKQDATQEGDLCDHVSVKEVSNCTDMCKIYNCSWGAWEQEEPCTATCGASVSKSKRSLVATPVLGLVVPPAFHTGAIIPSEKLEDTRRLRSVPHQKPAPPSFNGSLLVQEERFCTGSEVRLQVCPVPACAPDCQKMTCTFSAWSEWSLYDTCGFEERHRHRNYCSECSVQVIGNLSETRVGPGRAACEQKIPVNCAFSDWGSWSHCINSNDQKMRVRDIQVHVKNGGLACNGTLEETAPCGKVVKEDQDCEISQWSAWGPCREVCENPAKLGHDDTGCPTGVQERTRTVLRYARGQGKPCNASLDEVTTCPLKPATCIGEKIQHCGLTLWSDWGICKAEEIARTRSTTLVAGAGNCSCHEPIRVASQCSAPVVDCTYSAWVWSACTDGKKFGHRQVHTAPTQDGKPCSESLNVIEPCEDPKKVEISDCEMSVWADWGPCGGLTGTTCGKGHQLRNRTITKLADYTGEPCDDALSELRACESAEPCVPDQDCEWYDWQEWHACTCTCGGGQRERTRHVKIFPTGKGKRCEVHDMKEAGPCNTQACDQCTNGSFSEWSAWGACSSSCIGGVTMRNRQVISTGSSCGFPAEGLLQEIKPCSCDVPCHSQNCEFGTWGEWSACSKSCNGGQYRDRSIIKQGYGHGVYCKGDMDEYRPCNPLPNLTLPEGCPASLGPEVPCVWDAWTEWGACTKTCGTGGQRFQSRRHTEAPATGFSSLCEGPSLLVGACDTLADCDEALGQEKIDCKWSDWGEWGACTMRGGQRHRHRNILQAAQHGGEPCVPDGKTLIAMQTDGSECPTRDVSHILQYCGWGDWEDWGACDATCGSGVQLRERSLGYTNAKPVEQQLSEMNAELKEQLQVGSATKVQHIAIAFCGGAVSLVLVLGAFRMFGACRNGHLYRPVGRTEDVFSRSAYAQLNHAEGGIHNDAYGARSLEIE